MADSCICSLTVNFGFSGIAEAKSEPKSDFILSCVVVVEEEDVMIDDLGVVKATIICWLLWTLWTWLPVAVWPCSAAKAFVSLKKNEEETQMAPSTCTMEFNFIMFVLCWFDGLMVL